MVLRYYRVPRHHICGRYLPQGDQGILLEEEDHESANQQASPREGTIPLYHDKGTSADPHQKEGGVVAGSTGDHPPKVATSA